MAIHELHAPIHRVPDAGIRTTSPRRTSSRRVLAMGRRSGHAETGLEEILSSALRSADNDLGQILQEVDEISATLKSDAPDPQTLRVAQHPAVWSALKQTLLDRELRYLALTDDLTCLYNRRGFFAAAAQQVKLATRNSQCLLLLYSDVLARLGGDEFVVLATESSTASHEILLRRLEKSLKKSRASESRYELSLSVGVARFDPKRAVSLGELMAQADTAMYEQKRAHRKTFHRLA